MRRYRVEQTCDRPTHQRVWWLEVPTGQALSQQAETHWPYPPGRQGRCCTVQVRETTALNLVEA